MEELEDIILKTIDILRIDLTLHEDQFAQIFLKKIKLENKRKEMQLHTDEQDLNVKKYIKVKLELVLDNRVKEEKENEVEKDEQQIRKLEFFLKLLLLILFIIQIFLHFQNDDLFYYSLYSLFFHVLTTVIINVIISLFTKYHTIWSNPVLLNRVRFFTFQ